MAAADFEVFTDPGRIDIAMVHEFLRTSYWAQGRSRELVGFQPLPRPEEMMARYSTT